MEEPTIKDRVEQIAYLMGLHTTVVATAERLNQEILLQMKLVAHDATLDANTRQHWENIVKKSNQLKIMYDNWVKKASAGAITDEGRDSYVEKDDDIRDDANNLAKFLCMIYDATYKQPGKMNEIFEFLKTIFPDYPRIAVWVINKFKKL